ncbi:hypothetical protein PLGE761_09830 [Pluralibacter gergoviae]|nr:Uncharacterised protein [Pluralibacter gergoviae]
MTQCDMIIHNGLIMQFKLLMKSTGNYYQVNPKEKS